MKLIQGQAFDEERALYAARELQCEDCTFAGPADGESAFKEGRRIAAIRCDFRLRYPFWHCKGVLAEDCTLTDTCRAAFWYTEDAVIRSSRLHGIKAMRECKNVTLDTCDILSAEFGWNTASLTFRNCTAEGEYFCFGGGDIDAEHLHFRGKYSFQYVKNATLRNCVLDTKDAFWHSENVTVYDSVIKGEYLAWYSKNLRLVRCHIAGTQPLCYAENLVLEDCTMEGCDLAFEYSSVRAEVLGKIDSVKNPACGSITADEYGAILFDEHKRDTPCTVSVRERA